MRKLLDFLNEYWSNLNLFQHILYYIAVPSTVVLIIQTLLSIIGLGADDDADLPDSDYSDGDITPDDADFTDGFRVFTIRGILAFFTIFSWTGIVLSKTIMPTFAVVILSVIAGIIAMLVVAAMFYGFSKLQQSGNLDLKNAVGHMGTVYLPVPEKRTGKGKVNIYFQERLAELYAVTDDEAPIPTGAAVKVEGCDDMNTLIVTKK